MRLIIPGLAMLALLLAGCGGDDGGVAATPTAEEAAGAAGSGSTDSIHIPSLDVDAPLTLRRYLAGEPLPSPEGPYDVAIYDFGPELTLLGGAPGEGGNVVLAGESVALVGCSGAQPPCNGVFVGLPWIEAGAAIELTWRGRVFEYQVVSRCFVETARFDDRLYERTAEEQLTLLTGTGRRGSDSGWSHVLIIIAKPAPRTAIEPCP